jgi:hypothetical protein
MLQNEAKLKAEISQLQSFHEAERKKKDEEVLEKQHVGCTI